MTVYTEGQDTFPGGTRIDVIGKSLWPQVLILKLLVQKNDL